MPKKKLNNQQLDKVTGGDYGREWNLDTFRQDYSTNTNETINPNTNKKQSNSENAKVEPDLLNLKQ